MVDSALESKKETLRSFGKNVQLPLFPHEKHGDVSGLHQQVKHRILDI
jgi:hypothetical protein